MILYLDTAALLKLYVTEQESHDVRAAVAQATVVATHRRSFEADWARLEVVVPTAALVRRAGDLAEKDGLRGSVKSVVTESVIEMRWTAQTSRPLQLVCEVQSRRRAQR